VNRTNGEIANYEYGYWNMISVPLAALVFGTLGAVLGIRGHRTGTSTGFALSIAIIFGYVTLANFMNVWAMGGVIPAYVASFAPLAVGMVVALYIMWRRNG
jgi:lipopolysaccharide export system permease protein